MACSIIRNRAGEITRVNAPNGRESKLFNSILKVQPNKEKALRMWAKVYTPMFKLWFGDWETGVGSKIVDENGEPLLVFHNTAFKQDKFKGYVTYFTDQKEYAETFKGFKLNGEMMYATFLNIRNPYTVPSDRRLADAPEEVHNQPGSKYYAPRVAKEGLEQEGHDGIIGTDAGQEGGKTYVSFEPNQIKSVDNKGTFLKFVDNIYYQQEGGTETSKASAQTVALVKDLLNRIGVKMEVLQNITVNGIKQDANGVADIMQKLVQVTQDKIDVALPEEAMHFVVEIMQQTDPALFNKLLREINGYEMLNRVFAEYGTNPLYQTADGKPDVIKLKKEAIAKVLVETIINKNEGTTEKPENLAKAESWWQSIINAIRGLFTSSGFDQAALQVLSGDFNGSVDQLRSQEVYLQASQDKQQRTIDNLLKVHNSITPGKDGEGYSIGGVKIPRRVTDIIKDWYSSRFADKDLTKSEYQTAVDTLKAEKGTAGHLDFENMLKDHFLADDMTLLPEDQRRDDSGYVSQLDPNNKSYYNILKANMAARLESFPPGTKFMAEVRVFNGKDLAGTIDFVAVTPQGKVSLLDWKFMDLNLEKEKNKDVPWYKVNAWRQQMKQYKNILQNNYGVAAEDFDQTRMIPIKVTYIPGSAKTGELPKFSGVLIGSIDVKSEERAYLLPVGLETERTGVKKIDDLIEKLNKVYENLSSRKVTPEFKEDKATQLNALYQAIRQLQVRQNIKPLLRQAKIINVEVERVIADYDNNFKGKDPSSFSRAQKNEFANRISQFEDALQIYKNLSTELKSLFRGNLTEENEKLRDEITKVTQEALNLSSDLQDVSNEFASEIVAKSQNVMDFLLPEKVIKGLTKWFSSTSTLQLKASELLYKLANRAFGEAAMDTVEQGKILQGLKKNYDAWAKKKGLNKNNYFDIIKKKGTNQLVDEFDVAFYTELKKKIGDKDYQWVRDNIDVAAYNAFLDEYRKKEYERIKNRPRFGTEEESLKEMNRELSDAKNLYNTTTADAPGWLLYDFIKKFPKRETWESKEWKELSKADNAPAKAFYDYIRSRNEMYDKIGYINSAQSRTFLPFIRKSLMEKIVMGGQVKLGEDLLRQITITEGEVGFGQIDPITKEPVYSIPKYFTKDTGEEVSEDLFRNMTLLNEMAIRYEYLSQIEDQMRLIVRVESNKKAIKTSVFGKTIYKEDGDPETTSDNSENTQLVRDMVEAIIYGHKFVESDNFDQLLGNLSGFGKKANKVLGINVFPEKYDDAQISLNKSLNSLNNFFQLKTLGLNPLSAMSNLFGGSFQSIINAGTYFTKSEFMANELKLASKSYENAERRLAALEYFLPLTENYNNQIAKVLSTGVNPEGVQEILMSLMRNSDQFVQSVNFFTYLDNSAVVDGKIVNAREYIRKSDKYQGIYSLPVAERDALDKQFEEDVKALLKEKGVMNIATLDENNSLVIPGIEKKDDSVFELRRKVQSLTKDALGNLSDDDVRRINLNILGKSFMVFKNWIPRLVDVRIGDLKYNSAKEAYEWGRSRMVMRVLSDGVLTSLGRFNDILEANEKGVEYMRELFEKKKAEYEKETGKTLNMTEQEFIDLIRKNVKDQAVDAVFYLTLTSLFLALKALAPDDEDDKLAQNRYRIMLRAVDKIRDEISYFYNPTSLINLTKSGIFPSTSLISNFITAFGNFGNEMYYLATDDVKAAEKNQVIKYFLKGFPVTYEFDLPLLLFFPDLAKDLGMKAQPQSRPVGM
jgi:hypothetical protein